MIVDEVIAIFSSVLDTKTLTARDCRLEIYSVTHVTKNRNIVHYRTMQDAVHCKEPSRIFETNKSLTDT